ncbi:IS110 family transposase [Nocardia gamkensis]|uniref:IS110 family transposase n=1 Tax=Nocardia gamkensis TaxID=352869 RepID=UPI001FE16549|nr:IS110 family transposase [Nocardia gamkensis]
MQQKIWAGVDVGKAAHHCVVVDHEGAELLSQRVPNDQAALDSLITSVQALADRAEVTLATDLSRGCAALLIASLMHRSQRVFFVPGHVFYHAAKSHSGERKTDAKDAAVIAQEVRMRRGLRAIRPVDEVTAELRSLTAERASLCEDRVRDFSRMRNLLLECFPALEAALDFARSKGACILLTKFQTPQAIREAGVDELTAWLKSLKVRKAATIASTAVEAAEAQQIRLTGETLIGALVSRLAQASLNRDVDIAHIDAQIEARVRRHRDAAIILSMPGFGVSLTADFLTAIGDITAFPSADKLAGFCGLAPVPRDSGQVRGNHRRPRYYNRRLLRACYLSAQAARMRDPASEAFYQRKRSEGKTHVQAVLALARRRINVLWAMLRDRTPYQRGRETIRGGAVTVVMDDRPRLPVRPRHQMRQPCDRGS